MMEKLDWQILEQLLQVDGFVGVRFDAEDSLWHIVVNDEGAKTEALAIFAEDGVLAELELAESVRIEVR